MNGPSSSRRGHALVLGAGIQGVCAAFALESRGYRVTVVEQAGEPMTRASGRNEAKIHLGFVYANDPSFRTSALMLDGALSFSTLLEGWLRRPLDWPRLRSRPFTYAVMPDSLLSFDEVCAFYDRIQAAYDERADGRHYLGTRPRSIYRPLERAAPPSWVNPDGVQGLIETAELAAHLEPLRREIIAAFAANEGIEKRYGHRVEACERISGGFRVSGVTGDGEPWQCEADIVVNCLWEGRLGLDEQMDLRPERSWVYRLKYRLLGQLPPGLESLPSVTMALGAYGDVATYQDGLTYFNWYPVCLQAWSGDLQPPPAWDEVCNGSPDAATAQEVIDGSLAALDLLIPGIGASTIEAVDAGVIFSWGQTSVDVDDPDSELHERYAIGVHAYDGYFSIDTGKFTCGPYFAEQLLEHLK